LAERTTTRLTEPERRLIAYVQAGTLDAEIAVRMGVPVGDVKGRIAALIYKLNLHSRAELVAWVAGAEPDTAPDPAPVIGEDLFPAQPLASRHSRRSILAAGLAGSAALGAGAAFLLTRSNGRPPVPAAPSSPAADTPVPTPEPQGIAAIQPAPGAFERLTYRPGERIDALHGIFFIDVKGAQVEGWSLRVSPRETPPHYEVDPFNRFVSATTQDDRGWLLDRLSGDAYSWPLSRLRFIAASEVASLLFEEVDDAPAGTWAAGSGQYHILDPALQVRRSFLIDGGPAFTSAAFTWDPWGAIIWRQRQSVVPQIQLWYLTPGGDIRPVFHNGDRNLVPLPNAFQSRRNGPVAVHFSQAQPADGSPGTLVLSLDPSGATISEQTYPAWPVDCSPSGSSVLWEESIRRVDGTFIGTGEHWPAVVLARADGTPIYRIKSAAIRYGDRLPGSRWTADEYGFTVQVREDSAGAREGFPEVRYALVRASDGHLSLLPPLPDREQHWFTHSRNYGPVPSPADPTLMSFGRLALLAGNRDTVPQGAIQPGRNPDAEGHWRFQATIQESGPTHLPPWGAVGDEMRFALPHGGHGAGPLPCLLDPKVEYPPFSNDMDFVVARTGDCLNVRSAPELNGQVVACLVDGTRVTLMESPEVQQRTSRGAVQFNDTGMWVYVRTTDAREGWVNGAYLDWA
jgi:DNA-binding CsgD family transcriptional regulator